MEFKIRRAEAADARKIASVHVESWKSTYAEIVPDEFLASINIDDRAQLWTKILASQNELMFLAEDETGIFGFVCGGMIRETLDSYDAELFAIYLLGRKQGKGAGRTLFQALTRALQAAGYSAMVLWVLKDNPAVKFYERMGGKQIAKKTIEIGGAQLEEVAFGWPNLEDVINETAADGLE